MAWPCSACYTAVPQPAQCCAGWIQAALQRRVGLRLVLSRLCGCPCQGVSRPFEGGRIDLDAPQLPHVPRAGCTARHGVYGGLWLAQ